MSWLEKFVRKIVREEIPKMAVTQQQFTDALARIDSATTEIAGELVALKEKIQGAGLGADVEASVLAQLQSAADRLESIEAPQPPPPPASTGGTSAGPVANVPPPVPQA